MVSLNQHLKSDESKLLTLSFVLEIQFRNLAMPLLLEKTFLKVQDVNYTIKSRLTERYRGLCIGLYFSSLPTYCSFSRWRKTNEVISVRILL